MIEAPRQSKKRPKAPTGPSTSTQTANTPAVGSRIAVVWHRIKQHKVVQWTLAYLAVAYTLLHGAEMLAGSLGWPHSLLRLFTLILILGIPVVATLAWYHGARGQQRASGCKRLYTSGSVRTKITGFFEVDGTQEINKPASITDDGHTWIQYGVSGADDLNVLFTNAEDMAENGVTIGVGPNTVTATSTSGECKTKFDVKPATIEGHYSCTGSTGYNNKAGQMGKVDIEVEFNAGS